MLGKVKYALLGHTQSVLKAAVVIPGAFWRCRKV